VVNQDDDEDEGDDDANPLNKTKKQLQKETKKQAQKEQQEVYSTTFFKPGFQTYARRKREKRK
jgi:hypothetical protein